MYVQSPTFSSGGEGEDVEPKKQARAVVVGVALAANVVSVSSSRWAASPSSRAASISSGESVETPGGGEDRGKGSQLEHINLKPSITPTHSTTQGQKQNYLKVLTRGIRYYHSPIIDVEKNM